MKCCAKGITAWIVGKSHRKDMELLMGYYQASNCTFRAIAQQMEYNDRRSRGRVITET
jgi:hypothetical protein